MSPQAEPCLKAKVPVEVLAQSQTGSVIVRLKGKNYGTTTDAVSVIYHGVQMPLMKYDECYSPGKHVVIGPIDKSPCPPLPPA